MKISIITTCLNRVATIGEAINSVMEQDWPELEYIIVDGASTDGTLDVIRSWEARASGAEFRAKHPGVTFRYISEPDHSMYEAINKGVRMATGDVVGLLHSDDTLFNSNTLSDIAGTFSQTGADFVYGDGLYVNAKNRSKAVRNWIGGKYRLWKVRNGWLPLHPTCYIRRDVMMRRGLYNETYKIAADTDFLLRYLLSGDLTVAYLHRYFVRMRMGGMSTSGQRRRQMWREDMRVYSSHGFHPVMAKLEKMMWKVPQFITAKLCSFSSLR